MDWNTVNESDWKLFRQKLPAWQEAYLGKKNREYAAILSGSGKASEKFWSLEKRIRRDKQNLDQIRMSRSYLYINISTLLERKMITPADLADFSDEFKERMSFAFKGE